MLKIFRFVCLSSLILLGSAYTIQSIIYYKIDAEKAVVKFVLQAHGQDVVGNFKGAKGEVKFDPADLANSAFNCTIDIATINTGIGGRDRHLQAKEFFNAADFPHGQFTSTKIEKTNEGYIVTGNFNLKETTKVISFPLVYDGNADAGVFKASFTIKRSEYFIGKADDDISDEVNIILEIPVIKDLS